MNTKQAKKLRRQYRKELNSKAQKQLKHTIFTLARKRDIIGIISIFEAIVIGVLSILLVVHK
ncbi:MAG: hypothetical protein ACTTKB_04555 [Treponema sp.]